MKKGKLFKEIFVLIILIAIVLSVGHVAGRATSLSMQFFGIGLYLTGIVIAFFIVKKNVEGKIFEKLTWHDGLVIIQSYLFQMALLYILHEVSAVLKITTVYKNQEGILETIQSSSTPMLIIMFSFVIFLGPILEELVFRGYIMNALTREKMRMPTVFFSAFIFAYLHLHSILITGNNGIAFLSYLIPGISLALTYRETKKLTASIVQHMLMNTIASIPIFIMITDQMN